MKILPHPHPDHQKFVTLHFVGCKTFHLMSIICPFNADIQIGQAQVLQLLNLYVDYSSDLHVNIARQKKWQTIFVGNFIL